MPAQSIVELNRLSAPSRGRHLRIAYLTMRDSNDRRTWSGTLYNMGKALERHCGEVIRIGPFEPTSLKLGKLVSQGIQRLTGRTYLYTHTSYLSKRVAHMAQKRLATRPCDVIFSPAGSTLVAKLKTRIPIVYLSDTTVRRMFGYNADFSRVLPSQIRAAEEIEQGAITKAAELVYPSLWAANSAIEDYGANPAKVNVVPFGANLDVVPSREEALRKAVRDRCQLLFVGVSWVQKGGDIAFETLLELEKLGITAELTVVGCTPPRNVNHPHLKVYPFLDKNVVSEREKLNLLYREADFFILPTRAECFGIAMCEANSFGVPVLATRTGGVPGVVREGRNGFLFSPQARGDAYAARIREFYRDQEAYNSLRATSRGEFELRLNWDAWGRRINEILRDAVEESAAPSVTIKGI